ncbi:MAG: hypothetical protein GF350_02435 [Chitinivibrionales bacterium]|nr:hypothetical protein [Chitinivibrionales bacterium]
MERESRFLEYKREARDYKKIAQTVVAFANGDGGRIVIGIDDKKRDVVGLATSQVDDLLERLPISLADRIEPPLFPQVYEKTIQGKECIVVQVFPGNQKPYFIGVDGIDKGVYIRIGSHTRRASDEVLEELRLLRSRIGYDEQLMTSCSLDALDFSPLPASLRTQKGLLSLDLIRHDQFTQSLFPTRGAILMFHSRPHAVVNEAQLIVSKMRGTRGRDTVETHEITGPLPHQIDAALAYCEEWLGRNPVVKRARYQNTETVIPLTAVREAISNAVFHRQYSITGPIKVACFADRLEVFSPGHFAGPFIQDSIGDGTSYIRNKVIALSARRLKLIEKRGTGIRLIIDTLGELGLEPSFVEGPNWFKVIMPFFPSRKARVAESLDEKAILELFEHQVVVKSSDVCSHLKISKATAVSLLDSLVKQQRIVRKGRGPATRYEIMGI